MTTIIVGLGNPGDKYQGTRHNMGFAVVNELAAKLGLSFLEDKTFAAKVAQGRIKDEKIFLVEPLTFMNESGRSVKPLMDYFGLDLEDLVVVVDDLDSPVGRVRLREKGSSGGQNGIKSLIGHLGTQEFSRVKVGIGRPKGEKTVINHVLSKFDVAEQKQAQEGITWAVKALEFYLQSQDFHNTMSRFNQ